jgi:MFS transporter, ACS family, hexuronate transporter
MAIESTIRSTTGPLAPATPETQFRWMICTILFIGVTVNYMDRQILGVFKTTLQAQLGWSEVDYSNLVAWFQGAYALGLLLMGRVVDRLGTRKGYSVVMVVWSLASIATGACKSLLSFICARSALGLGESGVFPASNKAVAEWFPKKERALAFGIFNSGTNAGAILTPITVGILTKYVGWRWSFVLIGSLGFLWLIWWLIVYREPDQHPRCSPSELAYIKSDPQEKMQKTSWGEILPHRQAWAFALGKFCIDPIWWFYLFWIPDFLQRTYKLNLLQAALPLATLYAIATLGSVVFGWLSGKLISRGSTVNFARKITMLICAVCVLPIVTAYHVANLWTAVLIVGIAAASHQGFSANLFTTASDMFPKRAVATVTGFGGMAGAVGGLFIAKIVGYVLQKTGSYMVPFFIAGSAYLIGLLLLHILAPRLEPVEMEASPSA